jgi:hypothetical protein
MQIGDGEQALLGPIQRAGGIGDQRDGGDAYFAACSLFFSLPP